MPRRITTHSEIEVKLRITDLPVLVRQLRRLGPKGGYRVLERNTLFDTPQSDFRLRRGLLRLRIESPAPVGDFGGGKRRAVLTSKAPVPASPRAKGKPLYKEKLEREVAIAKPAGWEQALRSLGFRPGFRYEKYRTTFRLGRLHLDLDETPVGTFLELEGPRDMIDRVARSLGFSRRDYIRKTYWDLCAADCRRRGLPPGDMLFEK